MTEEELEIIKWSITTLVGIVTFYIARFWAKQDRNIARDSGTLDRLITLLPSAGSILFLRQYEFGNVFRIERLDDLVKFQDECLKTEFAFIDASLEKKRNSC